MTSVPAKDILNSAIAAADWLLCCQEHRDQARFQTIFYPFVKLFEDHRTDHQVFALFLDGISDVFDILLHGKNVGHLTVSVTVDGSDQRKVEKTFLELSNKANDYLMFLLILAHHVDAIEMDNPSTGDRVFRVIERVMVQPPLSTKEDVVHFPELRLKIMMAGFNFLPQNSPYRYEALCMILDFAKTHQLTSELLKYLHQFDQWITQHQSLSFERRVFLSKAIIECMEMFPKMDKELYEHVKKLVKLLDRQTLDEELRKIATKYSVLLLKLAISIQDVTTFDDLFQLQLIHQLRQTSFHPLFLLGSILYQGNCADLKDFLVEYPTVTQDYGLNEQDCMRKLQLIVLASIPPTQDEQTKKYVTSYEEIANALLVSTEEAERLAIKAIGQKLIEGRLDQKRQLIEIRSNLLRKVEKAEWIEIHHRLQRLQDHLRAIQSGIGVFAAQ